MVGVPDPPCSPHLAARQGLDRDQTVPSRQHFMSPTHGFPAEIAAGGVHALCSHHQPPSLLFLCNHLTKQRVFATLWWLAEGKDKHIGGTRKLVFCLHSVYFLAVVPSPPGKLQAGRQRTDSGEWPLALCKRSASFFIKISPEFFLSKPSCDSQPARDHASPWGKVALDQKDIPKRSLNFTI